MSYLFLKICFKEKSLYYFHKKLKIIKKTFFAVFLGVFLGFFGGFFIANPATRRSLSAGPSTTGARCRSW
jgi:hypothetical protein